MRYVLTVVAVLGVVLVIGAVAFGIRNVRSGS